MKTAHALEPGDRVPNFQSPVNYRRMPTSSVLYFVSRKLSELAGSVRACESAACWVEGQLKARGGTPPTVGPEQLAIEDAFGAVLGDLEVLAEILADTAEDMEVATLAAEAPATPSMA